MELFSKNTENEPVFIAEIGVNHEGSLSFAKKLMDLAKLAGYHAAKFQIYSTNNFLSDFFDDRVARAKKFELSFDDYNELRNYGSEIGLPIFASAISHDVVDFLGSDGVIKIASGDIDFTPLLETVSISKSKIILSIGASIHEEVDAAIKIFKKGMKEEFSKRLALLVCTSQYPCPIDDANIARINALKKYGCAVGYSNHVIDEEATLTAAALGADIFEFHFTDTKEGKTFHDHLLSFDLVQSQSLFEKIRKIKRALGSGNINRTASEQENYLKLRKGVVFSRPLKSGDIIKQSDLSYARPAIYFSSSDIHQIVGKALSIDVEPGMPVQVEHMK